MRSVAGLYGLLAALNLGTWVWAFLLFRHQPVLLGTAALAYGFGLRHAVDADHIAAIDGVTRRLMGAGRCPMAAGLFFAAGHSFVVILASAAVAVTATALAGLFGEAAAIGGMLGTTISAVFLFAIGASNLVILRAVWRSRPGTRAADDFDPSPGSRGLLARLLRPLLGLVTRNWHMLGIGFLFGLGFDTATEVALLGTSATEAARGVTVWSVMVFPALFAAGMTLVDTTDSVLMTHAYGWALARPPRRIWYNLVITAVSALVALLVGGIELLGLLGDRLQRTGPFLVRIGMLNGRFDTLGLVIIGLIVATWAAAVVLYRYAGLNGEGDTRQDNGRSPGRRQGAAAGGVESGQ